MVKVVVKVLMAVLDKVVLDKVVLDKAVLDKAALDKVVPAVVHLHALRQSLCLIYNPLCLIYNKLDVNSPGKCERWLNWKEAYECYLLLSGANA